MRVLSRSVGHKNEMCSHITSICIGQADSSQFICWYIRCQSAVQLILNDIFSPEAGALLMSLLFVFDCLFEALRSG